MDMLKRIGVTALLTFFIAKVFFPDKEYQDRLASIPQSATIIDNTFYDKEPFASQWFDQDGFASGLHVMNAARVKYMYDTIQRVYQPLQKRSSLLTVVDVGAGGGIATELLFRTDFDSEGRAHMGFNLTGIDISKRSLLTARNHYVGSKLHKQLKASGVYEPNNRPSLQYKVASAYNMSIFADHSVDVIVCTDVLEHLLDLRLAMREFNRVLRPQNGLFIFDTINRSYSSFIWVKRLAEWAGVIPPRTHDYRLFVTPHEIFRLVQEESNNTMKLYEITGLQMSLHFTWTKSTIDLSRYIDGVKFTISHPTVGLKDATISDKDTSIGIIGFALKRST